MAESCLGDLDIFGVFGPGDILKPYPSYGFMPAAEAVRRLSKTAKLDAEGLALVAKFADFGKGGMTA